MESVTVLFCIFIAKLFSDEKELYVLKSDTDRITKTVFDLGLGRVRFSYARLD
jgi:hypothetical protein